VIVDDLLEAKHTWVFGVHALKQPIRGVTDMALVFYQTVQDGSFFYDDAFVRVDKDLPGFYFRVRHDCDLVCNECDTSTSDVRVVRRIGIVCTILDIQSCDFDDE
jgi:hypothetical protein